MHKNMIVNGQKNYSKYEKIINNDIEKENFVFLAISNGILGSVGSIRIKIEIFTMGSSNKITKTSSKII